MPTQPPGSCSELARGRVGAARLLRRRWRPGAVGRWRVRRLRSLLRACATIRAWPAVRCRAGPGRGAGVRLGAFPAVSLMGWVSAAHCSYRALPDSSRCRSAASRPARDLALAAPVSSCCTSAAADCWSASASACAVRRSVPVTSGGALAWARSPARIRDSSSPRGRAWMMPASSRISSAVNTALRMVSSSGLPRCGCGETACPGLVIPAASR